MTIPVFLAYSVFLFNISRYFTFFVVQDVSSSFMTSQWEGFLFGISCQFVSQINIFSQCQIIKNLKYIASVGFSFLRDAINSFPFSIFLLNPIGLKSTINKKIPKMVLWGPPPGNFILLETASLYFTCNARALTNLFLKLNY